MKKLLVSSLALAISLSFVGCNKPANPNTITVGASPSPHGEILEFVKPQLEKQGIQLTIKTFTDYVLPNNALTSGELDVNFFQHAPYLKDFNEKNKTNLVSLGGVHFEPLGIYPGKTGKLTEIKEGATIAIPNDTTNEARALNLLQQVGLIQLKPDAGLLATPKDIVENKHKINFVELEAAQIAPSIKDVDFAIINGNYALLSKLESTVLEIESATGPAAQSYANILVTTPEKQTDEKLQKLLSALKSEETKAHIQKTYQTQVVPVP